MTLKTSDLCDACDEALPCALSFRGWGQRRAFAGNIRTLRVHEDIALMRDAVNQPGHGQVLVIDGGGSLSRAIFGDVMAGVASRNGWAGLVIHGAIRDGHEIDGMDIGVKALGTVPKRGQRTGAGEVDVPVTFGGITFVPGRRLVADDDGVIVLPEGVTEADIRVDEVVAATAAYAGTTAANK
ncbi:MAG: ribonuclease E inhibitor RraA [Comamonadaceae bacterium]|nr:MAG: ribonuclease E inhibitor RraA [Comamonadaceae bacterium]